MTTTRLSRLVLAAKGVGALMVAAVLPLGISLVSMSLVVALLSFTNVQLSNPVVSRWFIGGIFVLAMFALCARFSRQRAGLRKISVKTSILGTLKLAAFAASLSVLALAGFNPVGGSRVYVVFDAPKVVGTPYTADMLRVAAAEIKKLRQRGVEKADIRVVDPGLENQLFLLSDSIDSSSSLLEIPPQLLQVVEALDPLEARLKNLREDLVGARAGDSVVIFSSNGYAPSTLRYWPFDEERMRSRWVNVNPGAEANIDRVQLLSWRVLHDPTFQARLIMEFKFPKEGAPSPPGIAIRQIPDKLKEKACIDIAKSDSVFLGDIPPLNHDDPHSYSGSLAISEGLRYVVSEYSLDQSEKAGSVGVRHVTYAIDLPQTGADYLCVEFAGDGWRTSYDPTGQTHPLVRFSKPVYIGVRSLSIYVGEKRLRDVIDQLTGPDDEARRKLTIAEDPKAADAVVVSGDCPVAPAACVRIELFPSASDAPNSQETLEWTFIRRDSYYRQTNGMVWPEAAHYSGSLNGPSCVDLDVRMEAFVDAQNDSNGSCRRILRKDASELVQLQLPEASWLSGRDEAGKAIWAHLLRWALTLAWRGANANVASDATQLEVVTPASSGAVEFGWAERPPNLLSEIFLAIRGELGYREAFQATNNIRGEYLEITVLLLCFAISIGILQFELLRSADGKKG